MEEVLPNVHTEGPVATRGLSKFDIFAILFIGEVFGLLILFIRHSAHFTLPALIATALPVVMPLIALFCLWALATLGRKRPALFELGKYAAIGFFNTALDFTIINILVSYTGYTEGFRLGMLNAVSFTAAVFISYFGNKFWTFRSQSAARSGEFIQFVAISLIGLVLNSGFITLFTTYLAPVYELSAQQWVNVAKVFGIFISLAWNFAGYKFFVFKEKK